MWLKAAVITNALAPVRIVRKPITGGIDKNHSLGGGRVVKSIDGKVSDIVEAR